MISFAHDTSFNLEMPQNKAFSDSLSDWGLGTSIIDNRVTI